MRLRDLSDVKLEVLSRGAFTTPWVHDREDPIVIINPLTHKREASLYPDGHLIIAAGYMCDGPSGPTIDDASNRIPAIVHDVAYQLLRAGLAPPSLTRKSADQVMRRMLLEHGMPAWRARLWYWALRWRGGPAARPCLREKKYTLLEA